MSSIWRRGRASTCSRETRWCVLRSRPVTHSWTSVITRGWRVPLENRSEGTVHRYIITHNAPDLADVPLAASGLPLGRYPYTRRERWAARMSRRPVSFRAYPFGQLDRIEARLGLQWQRARQQTRHVPRPSYRYAEWLRGPLRHLIEEVLLDPRTLTRSWYRARQLNAGCASIWRAQITAQSFRRCWRWNSPCAL